MTIILGSIVTAPNNTELTFPFPRNSESVYACRIANVSASVIVVLKEFLSDGQSREYLLCGQQMVYKLQNASVLPSARANGGGITNVALLIEWSDDPDTDFIGSYPCSFDPTSA